MGTLYSRRNSHFSRHLWTSALVVCAALCGGAFAKESVSSQPADDDTLVVVNYFAGWWKQLPNKWQGAGWNAKEPNWRPKFPGRVPLLGQYNTQATMDREIVAAAKYGVDAFAILWYYPKPGGRQSKHAPLLNRGLETYLASPQAGKMRFFIEYCNAPDFSADSEKQWRECVATWVKAMRNPSYLRVDERLVFKVHGVTEFLRACDNDLALCRKRLGVLRDAVRDAGLGEMIIGVGVSGHTPPLGAKWPPAGLFDFTATYMTVPEVKAGKTEYPYAALAAQARTALRNRLSDPLPWMPYIAAGWNPRPWTYPAAPPHYHRFFAFPTREEFTDELKAMKAVLSQHPSLGLPKTDGTRQKVFTIYAWNEFGEGGIVAPTKGNGYRMLECIKDVFGAGAASGTNRRNRQVEPSPDGESSTSSQEQYKPLARIAVRAGEEGAQFMLKGSRTSFFVKGFNYVRLRAAQGPTGGDHATFDADARATKAHYAPTRAEAMFCALSKAGYNTVRVFVIGRSKVNPGIAGNYDTTQALHKPYMKNVLDFLRRATRHGIRVFPTFGDGGVPLNAHYRERLRGKGHNKNVLILTTDGIAARVEHITSFLSYIKGAEPALLPTLLGLQCQNEAYLRADQWPFTEKAGTFTAANGKTYDLSKTDNRQALMDDGYRYYHKRIAAAVKAIDPEMLVAEGVFVPRAVGKDRKRHVGVWPGKARDERYPPMLTALGEGALDFLDVHFYRTSRTESVDQAFRRNLASTGFFTPKMADIRKNKPVILGEFGAFNHVEKTFAEAVDSMVRVRDLALAERVNGMLYWTYDCLEQPRLYHAAGDWALFVRNMGSFEPNAGAGPQRPTATVRPESAE